MTARAVITGIGVAAPGRAGVESYWDTVLTGTVRTGPISTFDPSRYPSTLAGEVTGFEATDHVPSKLTVQTDRWTWLGFAAAAEALAGAGLDLSTLDPYASAVVLASSSGGNVFGQKELQRLWSQPARTVGAYQSIAWFYAASVGQLSIGHGIKGPNAVLAAESAGGLDSVAHAVRCVRRGTSVVLAGGTEAPLSPYALACQARSGWLSTGTDPATAYQPFDAAAAGFVPGEGGAVLVVEDHAHAHARGAPVLAEVLGWGATHDGEATRPGGSGSPAQYARAMRLALDRSAVAPSDVDLVIPDALGVPEYDATEASALRDVFGPAGPVVSTHKPLVGRLYQGGSALDMATAVLAMVHATVPASAGPRDVAPGCELRFARETSKSTVDTVLVAARGFDGFNTALVLRRGGGS